MLYALEDSVLAVAKYLPPCLVSSEAIANIAAVTRYLPDALSYRYGFESRLDPHSPTVDFVMLVTPSRGGREILAGLHPTIGLSQDLLAHGSWLRVREFARQWANPESSVSQHVHGVWLEFDVEGSLTEIPVPGIFFNIDELGDPEESGTFRGIDVVPDHDWVVETAIPLLQGGSTSPTLRRSLAACFDRAGSGVRVLQIGLFPSRKIDAVRLFAYPLSKEHLLAYLASIGWPGSIREVERVIAPFYEHVDRVYLDVDVGEAVYPKIGIECHFEPLRQPAREPRWQLLLDHLVTHQLCTLEKRDALLSYPGYAVENILYERLYIRGLHHVKVVYQPGRPLQAKAYFGCQHQPADSIRALLEEAGSTEGARRSGILT